MLGSKLVKLIDDRIYKAIDARIYKALAERAYLPPLDIPSESDAGFMQYSTCCARDFLSPRFQGIVKMLRLPMVWHRKTWEWVFVVHHIIDHIEPGSRGLVFGVGTERLPSLFASLGAHITATDAPTDAGHWSAGNQWSGNLDGLREPSIIPNELFDERVSFQPCDMNNIAPNLRDYDFNWSSCALEHLGSLRAGLDFIKNSLDTLKPGGIAVHTTEVNLSSNTQTMEHGDTVLYRRSDLEAFVEELRNDGHQVEPFTIAPMEHFLDNHVDVPPFTAYPHLKLKLAQYVTTSGGIVVRKRQ
jgi:SAM-dependent methyltransferase